MNEELYDIEEAWIQETCKTKQEVQVYRKYMYIRHWRLEILYRLIIIHTLSNFFYFLLCAAST